MHFKHVSGTSKKGSEKKSAIQEKVPTGFDATRSPSKSIHHTAQIDDDVPTTFGSGPAATGAGASNARDAPPPAQLRSPADGIAARRAAVARRSQACTPRPIGDCRAAGARHRGSQVCVSTRSQRKYQFGSARCMRVRAQRRRCPNLDVARGWPCARRLEVPILPSLDRCAMASQRIFIFDIMSNAIGGFTKTAIVGIYP